MPMASPITHHPSPLPHSSPSSFPLPLCFRYILTVRRPTLTTSRGRRRRTCRLSGARPTLYLTSTARTRDGNPTELKKDAEGLQAAHRKRTSSSCRGCRSWATASRTTRTARCRSREGRSCRPSTATRRDTWRKPSSCRAPSASSSSRIAPPTRRSRRRSSASASTSSRGSGCSAISRRARSSASARWCSGRWPTRCGAATTTATPTCSTSSRSSRRAESPKRRRIST